MCVFGLAHTSQYCEISKIELALPLYNCRKCLSFTNTIWKSSLFSWSFGILMFEIITLGGSPYPGVQPDDMLSHLEQGNRMEQPDNCPDEL
jgi:hypothetical protein